MLFKSKNQAPSSLRGNCVAVIVHLLVQTDNASIEMFRKSILKTTQLQSYLCLGSPSQLLPKDLQTIILIAVVEGQSMFFPSP